MDLNFHILKLNIDLLNTIFSLFAGEYGGAEDVILYG